MGRPEACELWDELDDGRADGAVTAEAVRVMFVK